MHQYTHRISAFGLDTDAKRLGRLFFQPLLMGAALYSTGALNALQRKKLAASFSKRLTGTAV